MDKITFRFTCGKFVQSVCTILMSYLLFTEEIDRLSGQFLSFDQNAVDFCYDATISIKLN